MSIATVHHGEIVDPDAVAIGELYAKAKASIEEGLIYAAKAGDRLNIKQASLPHGAWLPWLEDNEETLGFENRSTASRLQKHAREHPELVNGALTHHLGTDGLARISGQLWGNTADEDDDEAHVRGTFGTGENEWYTPAQHIELARKVLGEIDLDPASNKHANKIVKAKKFFSKEVDGLGKDWNGRIWLNPPYAQPFIDQFARKMIAELEAGRVKAAIMLTHNYTDTAWFQSLAQASNAMCFTRGRIRFEAPDGTQAAPTQGQAFFYFGSDIDAFGSVFVDVGFVVERNGP